MLLPQWTSCKQVCVVNHSSPWLIALSGFGTTPCYSHTPACKAANSNPIKAAGPMVSALCGQVSRWGRRQLFRVAADVHLRSAQGFSLMLNPIERSAWDIRSVKAPLASLKSMLSPHPCGSSTGYSISMHCSTSLRSVSGLLHSHFLRHELIEPLATATLPRDWPRCGWTTMTSSFTLKFVHKHKTR